MALLPRSTFQVRHAYNHSYDTHLCNLGYMGRTIANPKFDWTFLSVPQKGANNRVVLQPRGKGLGGSSLVRLSLSATSFRAESHADQLLWHLPSD